MGGSGNIFPEGVGGSWKIFGAMGPPSRWEAPAAPVAGGRGARQKFCEGVGESQKYFREGSGISLIIFAEGVGVPAGFPEGADQITYGAVNRRPDAVNSIRPNI